MSLFATPLGGLLGQGAWAPASLPGLVDWWDPGASYCTTDAGVDLESGSNQYLSHAGNATLRGGSSWYRCGWFKLESTGVAHTLMSTLSGNDGYEVRITSGDVLEVEVGTGSATNAATHATSLSTGTWYFWEAQYDGTDVGIALNGGAFTTETTAFSAGSAAFRIGSTIAGGSYADGVAQLCAVLTDTPSSAERTALYASGSPTTYADSTMPADIASWWNLHEASGTRVDSVGNNDLTAVNSPGYAAGVASGPVQDQAPVKTWTGRRNGEVVSQSTITQQPIWNASGQNGMPTILFDGVDDELQAVGSSISSLPIGANPVTVYGVAKPVTAQSQFVLYWSATVGGDHFGWKIDASDNWNVYVQAYYNPVLTAPTGSAVCLVSRYDGSSVYGRKNGVDGTSRSVTTPTTSGQSDVFRIGSLNGTALPFAGHVGTFIVQAADATASQISSAESYLNNLYAVY